VVVRCGEAFLVAARRLDLEMLDGRRHPNGVVYVHHRSRGADLDILPNTGVGGGS
jgi:hypothetical protein